MPKLTSLLRPLPPRLSLIYRNFFILRAVDVLTHLVATLVSRKEKR